MQSRSSHPEWFEELLKMQASHPGTDFWVTNPEWAHFFRIYRRILRASMPNWRQKWVYEHLFEAFAKNSLNSRILYASKGRPIALKQLEEVWNLYIIEKLIS